MKESFAIEVDCANCAAKVEAAVAKLPGVTATTVNYFAQRLYLEWEDGLERKKLIKQIRKEGRRIEPDFEIEE